MKDPFVFILLPKVDPFKLIINKKGAFSNILVFSELLERFKGCNIFETFDPIVKKILHTSINILEYCLLDNRIEHFKLVLGCGFTLDTIGHEGNTPFHYACMGASKSVSNVDLLKLVIKLCIDKYRKKDWLLEGNYFSMKNSNGQSGIDLIGYSVDSRFIVKNAIELWKRAKRASIIIT